MSEPPRIDARARAAAIDVLEREPFDCIVVGGGITGAGVAREAALRGLRVALLEAADFASGTSSRSSKLIHGGLRYLAQGEIGLVRETALERKHVHALAPHLAEPCWMVVPARSRAGVLKFRAGIGTYERLGAVAPKDRHQLWSGDELREREPVLARERYPYACAYREYKTDDARLVLANLRAAVAAGATVLNRARVDRFVFEEGRISGVEVGCEEGGVLRRAFVRGRCVVNAAGPWVEAVAQLGDSQTTPRLHLSKGVHASLPAERLPVRHLVILGTADRRSIFAIPHGEVVYLGTTDRSYAGAACEWPEIERHEVEYLLEPLTKYFDVDPIAPEECVTAWSGLRPLVAQPGKAATEISRKDEVDVSPTGIVTIAGGKLTGYRGLGEQVVARIGDLLGKTLAPLEHPGPPLPGGDFAADLASLEADLRAVGSPAATAQRLARLYGAEAHDVWARGGDAIVPDASVVTGEIDWAIEVEGAMTLEDVLYRRMRAALWLPSCRNALAEPVAERMRERLDWADDRAPREVQNVARRMQSDLEFTPSADTGS